MSEPKLPESSIEPLVPCDPPADTSSGLPYATHAGAIVIGSKRIRVYQLNTGERIINAEDLEAFFR